MRHIAWLLTGLLILSTAYLLQTPAPTGNATAQAGAVTELQVTPTTPYGGLYGNLNREGAVKAQVTRAEVKQQDLYKENSSCQKTDVIASPTPLALEDIQKISPANADAMLDNNPLSPFSITRMYTQEETYTIGNRQLQLWTLATTGQLGNYVQAVAQANGQVIFISQGKQNGLAYNGESASYQALLPAGEWVFRTDPSDTCPENAYIEDNESVETETSLQSAIPKRVCVNQENTLYAVDGPERTLCRPSDVPEGCQPRADVQARILLAGQEVQEVTTDETGAIPFTPSQADTYTIDLRADGERSTKRFSTQRCLEYGLPSSGGSGGSITYERNDVTVSESGEPQTQEPAQPATTRESAYMIVLLLGSSTLLASAIIYGRLHADDSVAVLRLRILWERLKRLLR